MSSCRKITSEHSKVIYFATKPINTNLLNTLLVSCFCNALLVLSEKEQPENDSSFEF